MTSDEEFYPSLKPFYVRQTLFNFSNGIISPYVSVYAVQLGASSEEMGWLRSLMSLMRNVMQIPWGSISDKIGRYIPAIFIGGILSSLLWVPLLFVTTPFQYIIIIAFQSFTVSISTPAWAALIGRMIPISRRGAVTARLSIAALFGSIGATILSGYIMTLMGGNLSNMYMIPIILAAFVGIMSSLLIVKVHEEKNGSSRPSSSWIGWEVIRSNANFQSLCKVSFLHSFFMSVCWPLLSITTVQVVKANMMEIAYISVISSIVGILIRRFVGHITDYTGRRVLLIIGRAGIFIFPILYALATNVYYLLLANLINAVFGAISEIVLFAYQLDIIPPDKRGSSIALYNTVNGVATFFGSLFGGYFPAVLTLMGCSGLLPIQLTYIISAVGRLSGGLLFIKLRESGTYPSTVKREVVRILREDVDRTKEGIEQIDKMGEMADSEFQRDFERSMGIARKKEEKIKRRQDENS